jgi:hypothetical protein
VDSAVRRSGASAHQDVKRSTDRTPRRRTG